jgi:hypothetical protein
MGVLPGYNAGSDNWSESACKEAQFNPNDPNYWFAINAGFLKYTGKIYRTTNAGSIWESIGDGYDFGEWNILNNFKIHPIVPETVYVATEYGLYRSTNATNSMATAVSWQNLTILPPQQITDYMANNGGYTPTTARSCYDVELVINNPSHVIASIKFYGKDASIPANEIQLMAYMQSLDGGDTWSILPNHPAIINYSGADTWFTIETCKAYPNYLFLWGGSTLNRFNITSNNWKFIDINKPSLGYGHTLGLNHVTGDLYAGANMTGYAKYEYNSSTDLYVIYKFLPPQPLNQYPPIRTSHDDNQDFISDPASNTMWVANDGGIAKSIDGGSTWQDMSVGLGLAIMQQGAFSADDGTYMMAGLYHDGHVLSTTPYTTTGWNPDWLTTDWGDGNSAIIDNKNSNYMYTGSQLRWTSSDDKYVSSTPIENIVRPWDNTMVLDKNTTSTLFRGVITNGKQEIARSFNRGITGSNDVISDLKAKLLLIDNTLTGYQIWRLYTPEGDSKHLIAHVVYKSTVTGGQQWSRLFRLKNFNEPNLTTIKAAWEELPLPSKYWCGEINFDPANPNILYIPYSTHNNNIYLHPIAGDKMFRGNHLVSYL